MMLRPRQKQFVERSTAALHEHGNTLGVAPTGAGKTVMLSAVTGELLQADSKACVLAHRDELTAQNEQKFLRVNPGTLTSIVDAGSKDWSGNAVFAMVQTLARETALAAMPPLSLLVIDEAHHITASSYLKIIERAKALNPAVKIYGVTATPNRGDKKALREVFTNVADQIRIGELVASGHLVPPRTFVIDVGTQEQLKHVKRVADDFDMHEVEKVMNRAPVTEAVIRHWREKAGDRQTVIFCSTVAHARGVTKAYCEAGIVAAVITGDMPEAERKATLDAYAQGNLQVLVNVAVLTEGWDCPPTACVVLLRPSSHKSTMIQMIGRGLRTVDPALHPGVIKTDCIVLDFGTSTLMHGSLEQEVDFDCHTSSGEKRLMRCPNCKGDIPARARECPLCGAELAQPSEEKDTLILKDFAMCEIDLLKRSSFRWCDLFGDDAALVAQGFNAWSGIFFLNGRWHAVGGNRSVRPRLLSLGERTVCLAAADDWLNTHESEDTAHKSKRWLNLPPTDKQLSHLPPEYRADYGLTRYQASALLTFHFNRQAIRELVFDAAREMEAA